ncbi:MAG: NAD(P)H-hydrate epimerase [bacterium]|nr:NAD(P)H-hydrate epimerase [bacterium]
MELSLQQARRYDALAIEKYGIPGIVLMENAARGCCDRLLDERPTGEIAIVCGGGNNAGDGFAIARRLDLLGLSVKLVTLKPTDQLTGDAATNYQIAAKSGISQVAISADSSDEEINAALGEAEWIIDAMLGAGAAGDPRPPFDRVIEIINSHPSRKFAVDLPSGLDGDTGQPGEPTLIADITCTFVAGKRGLFQPSAQPFVGDLAIVDIGAPPGLLNEVLAEGDAEPA